MERAGVDAAVATHLVRLRGVLGVHLALRSHEGQWREAAKIGHVLTAETEAAVAAFDPTQTGGTLKPLQNDRAGWLAIYSSRGPTLDMVLTAALVSISGDELQTLLGQIEDKTGWVLVAAERAEARDGTDRQLSVTLGAALLKEAAEARELSLLHDQWIARLELALVSDAIAVCTVSGEVPKLTRLSGGGLVLQPSMARTAVEKLAEEAITRRIPQSLTASDEPELDTLGAARALVIPVYDQDPCRAVVIALWRDPKAHVPETEAADLIGRVLGETLQIHSRANPSLSRRLGNWVTKWLYRIFGRRHRKPKIFLVAAALALLLAFLIPAQHEPSFNARIEARERQVIAAPFDGFVADAPGKVGDLLPAGAVVLRMDDTDLLLERSRIGSELERLASAMQSAKGKRDTAEVRNLDSQIEQAEVELSLLDSNIQRATMTTDAEALIIGGDGWKRIGARVRQGETLVELSHPEKLAVLAFLDEDWVSGLPEKAEGALLLAAYPQTPIRLRLERITAETEQVEGKNSFLAWFILEDTPKDLALMDGMRGILTVEASQTSLLGKYGRGIGRWFARKIWLWS